MMLINPSIIYILILNTNNKFTAAITLKVTIKITCQKKSYKASLN